MVPPKVELPGLDPIASVMVPVKPVAVLPCASCAATLTALLIAVPAEVDTGCAVNPSLFAGPAVISNALLVAFVRPVLDATSV